MKNILKYCIVFLALIAAAACKKDVEPVAVQSVTLDAFMIDLVEGEMDTLTVTVNPYNADNQAVVWESDDESVAVVSEGIVTAVHEGVAIISVTSEDGNKRAECAVTVKPIDVESIELDKTSLELIMGNEAELTATILPQDASHQGVMWSSSDYSIASVDIYGVVKGVKEGTATITATSEYGSLTADCEVTVLPIPVESIELDKTTLELILGNEATLTATILPQNASYKGVIWSSSDPSVASVDDNGVVKAIKEGTATITATSEFGSLTADCEVTVLPIPMASLELDKTELELMECRSAGLTATYYLPNGTVSSVTLVWSSDATDVAIVDSDGKVTAVAKGTATITVSTDDGRLSASCAVNVVPLVVNGHDAVNLGLSVSWATCNVGAQRPQDSGYYLSWAETKEKTNYHIQTYSYCEKSMTKMTKYCTKSSWGTVDDKTVLEAEDDAARVHMQGTWRIPTSDECKELVEKCKWTWNEQYKGYVITGPNGNCIFIPAAGYRVQTSLINEGKMLYFWNSSLNQSMCCAAGLLFKSTSSDPVVSAGDRYMGLTVRAVTE